MNKRKILIITLIFIIFILQLIFELFNPRAIGRDTVLTLGDGTYQILKSVNFDINDNVKKKNYFYNLMDIVQNKTIVNLVIKYNIDKTTNTIYIIGLNQPNDIEYEYTVLNYKTGKYQKFKNISEFEDNYQMIFKNTKNFKSF